VLPETLSCHNYAGSIAWQARLQEYTVSDPHSAAPSGGQSTSEPNARSHYEVTRADLPLHCPLEGMSLWNSHPRVYLPIEATGKAKCPYCGAEYTLVD
jgi:uncharacterized Zn-finger protein